MADFFHYLDVDGSGNVPLDACAAFQLLASFLGGTASDTLGCVHCFLACLTGKVGGSLMLIRREI